MTDTVNSPGVLCWPTRENDLGWRSVMVGFTDSCFPSAWIRVKLPAGQPATWAWLEDPGIVASVTWGIPTTDWWRFTRRIGLANTSVIIRFANGFVGGDPFTQVTVDLAFFPDFGPNAFEQYVFDRNNVSKITPWSDNGCTVVGGPGPCTSTGTMTLDWWPSACGVPEAGPTVPA